MAADDEFLRGFGEQLLCHRLDRFERWAIVGNPVQTFGQVGNGSRKGLRRVIDAGEKQNVHNGASPEEALAMMPENIWVNVDIKNNDPRVGKLVAETVGRAHRFDQVMFAARDKAVPTIRQVAKEAESQSWIVNMNRKLFRCQYVNATINSCAEFIQLVELPYIPFVRGKPNHDTMERLKDAGVRVNYSWLRAEEEEKLKEELQDLFNRKIDFVLVDHVEQAMKAADTLGIPRLIPYWNHATLKTDQAPFHCPLAQ